MKAFCFFIFNFNLCDRVVEEASVYVNVHLSLPHEPELEDIHVASTLNGLVARVVCDVVLFVWLEQVASTHGVAVL